MKTDFNHLSSHPELNSLLEELLYGVKAVLGEQLVGLALDGSLANGDFDEDSDIDFVVVTEEEISDPAFEALYAMHRRISALPLPFASQLEGSYLSRKALWQHEDALTLHPNLERGELELLKWAEHGEDWNVHRFVLRERGITLAGPSFRSLIAPVSPADLRKAMHITLTGWAVPLLNAPERINSRGYQSYIVLSLCRILYTLEFGDVVSKRVASEWAKGVCDARRIELIDRTWEGRHNPGVAPRLEEITATVGFLREDVALSRVDVLPL